jgi:hypothetical protein
MVGLPRRLLPSKRRCEPRRHAEVAYSAPPRGLGRLALWRSVSRALVDQWGVQLTSQYMVNPMVKLQFRVNDIALASIRNSYDIDGDLDYLLKHISGRKHKLHDRVLRTDERGERRHCLI